VPPLPYPITPFNGGNASAGCSTTTIAQQRDEPARQVVKIMRDVKPDSKVNVRILRDGKPRDFTIVARPGVGYMAFERGLPDFKLGGLQNFKFEGISPFDAPFMIHGPLADMELATLTPQLGRYFGTDKGVLVVREHKAMNVETTVPDQPATRRKAVILRGGEQHAPGKVVILRDGGEAM
jgi:hypothetical protein